MPLFERITVICSVSCVLYKGNKELENAIINCFMILFSFITLLLKIGGEMKTKEIIPVISYGNFSTMFLNYLLHSSKNEDIVLYLKLLQKKQNAKTTELYIEIDKAIKTCKNKGIKYLLLTLILDISKSLKMKEANKKLYFKLKREFGKIPPDYRSIIGKGIMSNRAYINNESYKEFRSWSDRYVETDIDKAVTSHTKALQLLNRHSDENEILKNFVDSYEKALKHPHPTFILSSLNNASWYLRKSLPEQSEKLTDKLGYYCGYYLEDINIMMDFFDTITSFYRMKRNSDFYDYSELFIYYYELYKYQNKGFEKKFKKY